MPRRKRIERKNHFLFLIPAAVFVLAIVFLSQAMSQQQASSTLELPVSGDVVITPLEVGRHIHVDFRVILDGKEVNFDRPEFDEVDPRAHLHIDNPEGDKVIHFEGRPVTIGFFFRTLGMNFNSDCFALDDGRAFCNDGEKRLRFFVNSEENFEFGNYMPRDTDRILVIYGASDEEIEEQIGMVTDVACVFSQSCPERENPFDREPTFF